MRNRTTWDNAQGWARLLLDVVEGEQQGERGRYGRFLRGETLVGEDGVRWRWEKEEDRRQRSRATADGIELPRGWGDADVNREWCV